MLIDTNGREVRADKLPRNPKARDAALASVREILVPAPQRPSTLGGMFKLEARAILREHRK
jgi:hypothetical protein